VADVLQGGVESDWVGCVPNVEIPGRDLTGDVNRRARAGQYRRGPSGGDQLFDDVGADKTAADDEDL
jgi:hypothetical protein